MKLIREREWSSSLHILDSGYNIAISEGNLEMASGFLVNKGLYHYYRRDLDSSIYYYNQSLILEEKLGRKDKVARRLRNIGLSYKQKGLFRQSLLYYQRALDIADHLDDNKLMASINNSIGLLYQGLNEYHESLKYLQSAKVLYQLEDYKKGLSTAYLNIGNVKNAQGDKEQALTDYFRSLKLARLSDSRVDNALKNIGEVYLDLDSLHLAVDYLAQAMEEMRKNENQRGIMSVLNQLGRLYQKGAAYGTSDSILLVAAKVAKQVDDQNLLLENYDFRRQLYRHVKDYSMAVFTDMKYDSLQEEIFRNERIKVQQIQADYDLSLANERARIAEQEKETERRNAEVTLTFSIALGLLFFVVLITSYFLYRSRQKLSAVNSDLHAKNQKIALLNKQNLHFTKNSLAEIVSLLSIQSTRTNNGAAQNVLRTGRLRVETVNLLYRLLFLNHSNQNNQLIRMDDYLSEIVLNTLDSMLGPDIEIKHDLDIEPIEIEHEDALQIGLIVNEICINSCKYAFSNCDSGVFKVQLTTESKCYQLVIGDNGQGLPDDFNEGSVNGFGVQLITALAHDLNAKFDVVSAKSGLNYYFHIPIMTLKDELQDINS